MINAVEEPNEKTKNLELVLMTIHTNISSD